MDQIEYESSCYFYIEETDETVPAHILYTDIHDGVNLDSRKIIVDAQTGEVLREEPILIPVKDRDIYDNNNTLIRPANPAREEGDPASSVDEVNNAYESSGLTWDLFDDRFDRDSFDDDGGTIEVEVRYGTINSARWDQYSDFIWIGGGSEDYDEGFRCYGART